MTNCSIVWFRRDLRLQDNPALSAAARRGGPVLCLFILDEADAGGDFEGAAGRWWLHHSLKALSAELAARGARLILRRGAAQAVLQNVIAESGADAVYWNRRYEPWSVQRDRKIKTDLREFGIAAESFAADMLAEPWEVKTGAGKPFSVFTPFWKALLARGAPRPPLDTPDLLPAAPADADISEDLSDWRLTPSRPNWAQGFDDLWRPGEAGAKEAARAFLDGPAGDYRDGRDLPAAGKVSRLSPHLHFGEISPSQLWAATRARIDAGALDASQGMAFLREVGWRDFNRGLLYHNPRTVTENFKTDFDAFPWRDDPAALQAWREGRTGYPFVDAGMRELWATGVMHNRVRMVVASFLVKHLLIDWREGEAWFRDTLVDFDLANNVGGWQWSAGSGADAAPYFRIFNPIAQGEKFDPNGAYTRRWVPELARLPNAYLQQPWTAPEPVLAAAGVALGETYPDPIVDHKPARERALRAYDVVKQARAAAAA